MSDFNHKEFRINARSSLMSFYYFSLSLKDKSENFNKALREYYDKEYPDEYFYYKHDINSIFEFKKKRNLDND